MSHPEFQRRPGQAGSSADVETVIEEPRLEWHGHPPRPIGVWDLNPGDAVWPGTPGSGENLCPDCSGQGQRGGIACHTCGGTGLVTVPVSGGV